MFEGLMSWIRSLGNPGGFSNTPSGAVDMPRPTPETPEALPRWAEAIQEWSKNQTANRPPTMMAPGAPPAAAPMAPTPLAPIFAGATQTPMQRPQMGLAAYLSSMGATPPPGIFRPSDARLKDDVRTLRYDSNGLRWVSWRWKDGRNEPTVGVIAQEVQKVRPDAVAVMADGFLGVDYGALDSAADSSAPRK